MAASCESCCDSEKTIQTTSSTESLSMLAPGKSRDSVLLATNSFQDLCECLNEQCEQFHRVKHHSGSISELGHSIPVSRDAARHNESGRSSTDEENLVEELDDSCFVAAEAVDEAVQFQERLTAEETEEDNVTEATGDNAERSAVMTSSLDKLKLAEDEPEDIVNDPEWRNKKKHVFILSEAGKPIYSRYGNEEKLVTVMGVMQALVSFVQHNNDSIRCIITGDHKFVFLSRGPMILVAVSATPESMQQLLVQLTYVYNQILSVLTVTQLNKIFKQRQNYDLRRLLSGAEKFIDYLLNSMDVDPCFLLSAVRCLPLNSTVRETIAQSIVQYGKVKDLVFAIVIADNQLVALVRMKKYSLHPSDLHLIMNLVNASTTSFVTGETWSPICLPKFDASGFLYAHISYLDQACTTCMLLLTVHRDIFYELAECKRKIVERLNRHKCLEAVTAAIAEGSCSIGETKIQDLRHFIYKSRSTAQFICPKYEAPYCTEEERQALFGTYQRVHNRIHSPTRSLKILFLVGTQETLLGWVTAGFELYAVFSPLITKAAAIAAVEKLLRWIKSEEDRLFILRSPTF